jgi:hypothetical protein
MIWWSAFARMVRGMALAGMVFWLVVGVLTHKMLL